MGGSVTSSKALTAQIVAIAAAIIGVAVTAGLDLSKDLQDHILTLITVLTPAIIGGISWANHNHAKVAAAREANNASSAARVNV
jgi:hypothetical protein